MKHQHRLLTTITALQRTGRRSAAVLAAFVLMITTGAAVAEAQPATPSPHWTQTPTGRPHAMLNDIDARPGATWAVGITLVDGYEDVRPLALHWAGGRWTATPQPVHSNATLESVAVAGADDVWAVGENRAEPSRTEPLVMHWNGHAWRIVRGPSVPTGSFDEVTVGPDGGVWAAGWADVGGTEHAVVYRYSGRTWHPLTAGLEGSINGNALTVLSPRNAWIGLNAGIAHFDGHRWTLTSDVPVDGSQIPTALAAAGPKDIWAVGVYHSSAGERPLALHYNGVSWSHVAVPPGSAQLYDVVLRKGRPIAVGESIEPTGDTRPFVVEYNGSSFVAAAVPTRKVGTLTSIDASTNRLWTAGLLITASTGEPSAFAAFAT